MVRCSPAVLVISTPLDGLIHSTQPVERAAITTPTLTYFHESDTAAFFLPLRKKYLRGSLP